MASTRTCHMCGQLGHIQRDCPRRAQPKAAVDVKVLSDNVMNYGSGVGSMPVPGGGSIFASSGPRGRGGASSGAGAVPETATARGYVEHRKAVRRAWPASAPLAQLEHATNMTDVETLFSIIQDDAVRNQLIQISAEQLKASRMVKEVYLPLGRKMELVTCEFDGGRTAIQESDNTMEPEHLAVFTAQCDLATLFPWRHLRAPSALHTLTHTTRARTRRFAGLPDKLRRTGIDGTLHRISRTVNPISGECTTVAARIGRVIQGHVEALLDTPHTKGVLQGRKSVLIIGPPNVGKTTVLREFARVLSEERSTRTGEFL